MFRVADSLFFLIITFFLLEITEDLYMSHKLKLQSVTVTVCNVKR